MLMTRRFFLKTTGAFAAYCGVAPFDAFSQHEAAAISNASAVRKGKTLVAVFLRGGLDGLNLVVPFGEKHYYDLRKSIAIPQPGQKDGALDLDGFFGLHPAAEDLMPLFQSGEAVAIQAVGYDKNTRSHFEEQDVWETGVIGNTVNSDGWLNRHLLTSEGHGPIRAIAIGNNLPRILRGDAPAYAVRGISDLTMPPGHVKETAIAAALEHAYCSDPAGHISNAREMLAQTAGATLEGIRRRRSIPRPASHRSSRKRHALSKRTSASKSWKSITADGTHTTARGDHEDNISEDCRISHRPSRRSARISAAA
jgi:uncharacterized protein (DUF1501 family)